MISLKNPWGTKYTWKCSLTSANKPESFIREDTRLDGPDCSAVMHGNYHGEQPLGPDPYIVLLIQVSDQGVIYEVKASGDTGGELTSSAWSSRVPNLPMAAMFLQEYAVGAEETFDIDWFYYSPDQLGIDTVIDHVKRLKQYDRYNNTGLRLARPEKYLGSCSPDTSLTTELYITLPRPIPKSMSPGETIHIVALPPHRQGRFRYTWSYTRHDSHDNIVPLPVPIPITPDYGGWEADFTFPQNEFATTLTIRLAEVEDEGDDEGEECTNEPVKPKEWRWVIRHRDAPPQADMSDPMNSAESRIVAGHDPDRPENAMDLHSYPNPFNPQTTLTFTLPEAAFVRLKIIDLTGREVGLLTEKYLDEGPHSVNWNASRVSTGVYVVVLQARHERAVTRLTVAK